MKGYLIIHRNAKGKDMKRIKSTLSCIGIFIMVLLIQAAVLIAGYFGIGIYLGLEASLSGNGMGLTAEYIEAFIAKPDITLLLSALASASCIIIFGLWYRQKFVKDRKVNLSKIFEHNGLLYITILGFGLQFVFSYILNFIYYIKPEWFGTYLELMNDLGMGNSLISFILIVIIAPLSEELIFRGIIFEKAKKGLSFLAANILQALLFGIMHGNIIQGIYTFILGLILGAIYTKRKSILAAIYLHFVINLSGVILDKLSLIDWFNNLVTTCIIGVISLIGIYYSMNKLFKNNGEDVVSE